MIKFVLDDDEDELTEIEQKRMIHAMIETIRNPETEEKLRYALLDAICSPENGVH